MVLNTICAALPTRASIKSVDLRFEVTARRSDGGASKRGIYLRDPSDASQPLTFQ
jgi:hypothetical protein